MLAAIKDSLKGFGDSAIEKHVRPPLAAKAEKELVELRTEVLTRLPAEVKTRTIEAARDFVETDDGEGMSALAAKFIRRKLLDSPEGGAKLDEVIAKFSAEINPRVVEATDKLDDRATEAGIRELKQFLHIIPDSDDEEGSENKTRALESDLDRALNAAGSEEEDADVRALAHYWSPIPKAAETAPRGERIALKLRILIRKLTTKLLPKITRSVPDVLQRAVIDLVEREVREEFDEMRAHKLSVGFIDKMLDKAEEKAVRLQRNIMDDFLDKVWENGVRDKCTREVVELLTGFEEKVAAELKAKVDSVPF
ncbi:hypothetical protein H9P43_004929 [Blastocladiella emersonii ATCC 22665]|nr:hypothetical protein H9P43_004929 [Blastocladiella emersonii ATCC 22665]